MRRSAELRQELVSAGKPADLKALDEAVDREIKAGKLKAPPRTTVGFQMRGPMGGYDPVTNKVSADVNVWQMVIIPYATRASLSLPEEPVEGMPWVMDSGTWVAHIMIQHNSMQHGPM